MNDQEILDNAPEGVTIVFNKDVITTCGLPAVTELLIRLNPRSLADIKRIVELESRISKAMDLIDDPDANDYDVMITLKEQSE